MRHIALLLLLASIASALSITIASPQNITYANASILVNITNSSDAHYVWFWNGTANETYTEPVNRTFAEGNNTLFAYANNSTGAFVVANVSFIVDTTPPGISISSPANISYDSQGIMVNITANDSYGINRAWFTVDGGAEYNYTAPYIFNFSVASHVLTAFANDSAGYVNSTNVSFSVTPYGYYEPSNNISQAWQIPVNGTLFTNAIYPTGDQDWFWFNATAGSKYLVKTSNLTGGTDTVLYVYKSDGIAQVGYNDDISAGVDIASSVLFIADYTGAYYVKVIDYSGTFQGGFYQLGVLQLGRLQPYLIEPLSNITVNQSSTFNFSAGVLCSGGPCLMVRAIADPDSISDANETKADKEVLYALETKESVDVIVKLKDDPKAAKRMLKLTQDKAISDAASAGLAVKKRYSLFNGFSARITNDALEKLEQNPAVERIYYDRTLRMYLDQSVPSIRANQAWLQQANGTNITGAGQTVCVVDTGVNYNHADFSGGVYAGGYDFVNNDSNPMDDQGHGSHVAGIIASQDATYKGVAPGARIAAAKVLNSVGSGSDSNIIAGIDWCTANAAALNITVITMSLGDNTKHTMPCPDDVLASAITNAIANNITVTIASGNNGWGGSGTSPGIAAPACVPNAVSVGATDKASGTTLAYNRALILTLLAPGLSIIATNYANGHTTKSGTSMATPHAAGEAALIQQAFRLRYGRMPTPSEVMNVMRYNGNWTYDSGGTNLPFARIDALSAVTAKGVIPMNSGFPFYTTTQNPSAYFNLTDGESANFTWFVNATSQGGAYRFFAVFEDNYTDYNYTPSVYITIRELAPPNLTILSPLNVTYNIASITIAINASDYSNVSAIWFYNGTANETYTEPVNRTFSEGANTLYVWANDTWGNEGGKNVSFVVDLTPPSFTSIANQTIANGTSLGVQFSASDSLSGVASWSVNDTANFNINASGYLANASALFAGMHYLNVSVFDSVNNTASIAIWINVTPMPIINSYSAYPPVLINGSNVTLFINASSSDNAWANVTRPDSSSELIMLVNGANTTYANTSLLGRYNITFNANNSIGAVNITAYSDSFPPITFSVAIADANGSGLNSTVVALFSGSIIATNSSSDGNHSANLPNTTFDFQLSSFSNRIVVVLRGVNASSSNNLTFGMDQTPSPVSGFLVTYAINNSYNFTNATVQACYNGTNFTNDSYLGLYKCGAWNFSGRYCAGSWEDITANASLNTTAKCFAYQTASFSAFSINQSAYCGDSSCNAGESCSSCQADCGVCSNGGTGGSGGGGGGGGGGSGGSTAAKRNVTLQHPAVPETYCDHNADCSESDVCIDNLCKQLTGSCGIAANHTWYYLECCDDSGCPSGAVCRNNECKMASSKLRELVAQSTQPNLTIVKYVYTEPKTCDCRLFGMCAPFGATKILGACWYKSLFISLGSLLLAGLAFRIFSTAKKQKTAGAAKENKKGAKKQKSKSGAAASALPLTLMFILILLIFLPLSHGQTVAVEEQKHPLYSSSYLSWTENITTYRFRIFNPYDSSSSSFRLWLESSLAWFEPRNFTYALAPDRIEGDFPYWDVPPLYPNETAEISFTVKARVGLPESVSVQTEKISRWPAECHNLVPKAADFSADAPAISAYLYSRNQSQTFTIYFKNNNLVLVHLNNLSTFAVFDTTNASAVRAVSSNSTIYALLTEYAKAASPASAANISKAYDMLVHSRSQKADAENECFKLTGMDRFNCTDRESCRLSCFSVQVCSYLAASGWSFIDSILDYRMKADNASLLIDRAIGSSAEFSRAPSHSTAQKAFDDMVTLNRAESQVIFHPLMSSYGFCPPPEYGLPEQMDGRRQVLDYLEDSCVYGELDGIADECMHSASELAGQPQVTVDVEEVASDNITVVAPQPQSQQNATNATVIIIQTDLLPDDGCCIKTGCSLLGIRSIAGVCWQWWLLCPAASSAFLVLIFWNKLPLVVKRK